VAHARLSALKNFQSETACVWGTTFDEKSSDLEVKVFPPSISKPRVRQIPRGDQSLSHTPSCFTQQFSYLSQVVPDTMRILNSFHVWAVISLSCSILVVKFRPEYAIAGSIFWSALGLFLVQFCCWSFYNVLIYPKYTSPLKGLPQPKV
jgi:hypothetical protein